MTLLASGKNWKCGCHAFITYPNKERGIEKKTYKISRCRKHKNSDLKTIKQDNRREKK